MFRSIALRVAFALAIGTAGVVGINEAMGASTTIPTVKIHCAFIQGGQGVSLGDLNVYRKGAVKRFCFVGARGLTGATGATGATGETGATGPAGADGKVTGTVAVCAANGGPLFLCSSPSGANKPQVGYLATP